MQGSAHLPPVLPLLWQGMVSFASSAALDEMFGAYATARRGYAQAATVAWLLQRNAATPPRADVAGAAAATETAARAAPPDHGVSQASQGSAVGEPAIDLREPEAVVRLADLPIAADPRSPHEAVHAAATRPDVDAAGLSASPRASTASAHAEGPSAAPPGSARFSAYEAEFGGGAAAESTPSGEAQEAAHRITASAFAPFLSTAAQSSSSGGAASQRSIGGGDAPARPHECQHSGAESSKSGAATSAQAMPSAATDTAHPARPAALDAVRTSGNGAAQQEQRSSSDSYQDAASPPWGGTDSAIAERLACTRSDTERASAAAGGPGTEPRTSASPASEQEALPAAARRGSGVSGDVREAQAAATSTSGLMAEEKAHAGQRGGGASGRGTAQAAEQGDAGDAVGVWRLAEVQLLQLQAHASAVRERYAVCESRLSASLES